MIVLFPYLKVAYDFCYYGLFVQEVNMMGIHESISRNLCTTCCVFELFLNLVFLQFLLQDELVAIL